MKRCKREDCGKWLPETLSERAEYCNRSCQQKYLRQQKAKAVGKHQVYRTGLCQVCGEPKETAMRCKTCRKNRKAK